MVFLFLCLLLINQALLRSHFINSSFVFHQGFQTLENKSTRPKAQCFISFLMFGNLDETLALINELLHLPNLSGFWKFILHTLTSVCIFSILFSIHSKEADKENLFNNQELHQFVIMSSILITFMFDLGGGVQ